MFKNNYILGWWLSCKSILFIVFCEIVLFFHFATFLSNFKFYNKFLILSFFRNLGCLLNTTHKEKRSNMSFSLIQALKRDNILEDE